MCSLSVFLNSIILLSVYEGFYLFEALGNNSLYGIDATRGFLKTSPYALEVSHFFATWPDLVGGVPRVGVIGARTKRCVVRLAGSEHLHRYRSRRGQLAKKWLD